MREITVMKNDAGQRLDKFLSKAVPALPQALMYKYLRTKYIKLNGKKASPGDRLSEGDRLTFYIRDEFFPVGGEKAFLSAKPEIKVVYEDKNLLLVDKPSGLIVHEDEGETADTLIGRVQHYLYNSGEYDPDKEASFAPALCNRIDRNTSGIVIVAKNAVSLRLLNECIRERRLHKYYLCLLKGVPSPREAEIKAFMRKDKKENKALVFDSPVPDGKTMVTRYRVIESFKGVSLAEIELKTGRTHQIRAHMAHIGCPLVGDGKYSDNRKERELGFKSQALCSYKLIFDFAASCELSYLNGKVFEIKDVPFADRETVIKLGNILTA